MQDGQPLGLIVAECGVGPERIRAHAARAGETLVIEQLPGEAFDVFADRVRAELAAVTCRGSSVTRVSLIAAGRAQSDTVSGRSLLVRGLASAMGQGAGGVIRLESGGGPERFLLASLASTMDAMLRGTGVAVRHVDLGERRRVRESSDRLTAVGAAMANPARDTVRETERPTAATGSENDAEAA